VQISFTRQRKTEITQRNCHFPNYTNVQQGAIRMFSALQQKAFAQIVAFGFL